MAMRNVVESDISGNPDASTYTFGLQEVWYEIDLTEAEQKELESRLGDFLTNSRRAAKKSGKKRIVPDTTVEERAQIRAWGHENGYEFAERGRIPKTVFAAYQRAHGNPDFTND